MNESETADHLRQSHSSKLPSLPPFVPIFCCSVKQPHNSGNMNSARPTTSPSSNAPVTPASAELGNFRDVDDRHSEASDSDQSDKSGRSLSPTRQGLSKTKKRKERRQFGAFADELGDLLGAAFQSKDESTPTGLGASTHAGTRTIQCGGITDPVNAPSSASRRQQSTGYLTKHAANVSTDADLEMEPQPTSSAPKMCMSP